jgi:hypothetical protein
MGPQGRSQPRARGKGRDGPGEMPLLGLDDCLEGYGPEELKRTMPVLVICGWRGAFSPSTPTPQPCVRDPGVNAAVNMTLIASFLHCWREGRPCRRRRLSEVIGTEPPEAAGSCAGNLRGPPAARRARATAGLPRRDGSGSLIPGRPGTPPTALLTVGPRVPPPRLGRGARGLQDEQPDIGAVPAADLPADAGALHHRRLGAFRDCPGREPPEAVRRGAELIVLDDILVGGVRHEMSGDGVSAADIRPG